MNFKIKHLGLIGLVTLFVICQVLSQFAGAQVPRVTPPTPEGVEFFESKIRPLLSESCYPCHSQANGVALGKLQLDNREVLFKGGAHGSLFAAKTPEGGLLFKAVGYSDKSLQMPPAGKLSSEKIALLLQWVKMGTPYPVASKSHASSAPKFDLNARKKHWSWQPLKKTFPPIVKNRSWVRNPIDQFVLAKLEAKGMSPAKPADKRTLLRRVTFDLIGLPPTPDEIEAFLADKSTTAYEKVVDRLLASPHYGERWARHWLDLVRYAETDGHEFDFDKPEAWQYRDYVTRALNSDLRFDQFATEHLAGDLLQKPRLNTAEGFNESILGTGFFWFGEGKHSPVELGADEAERIDNQVDVLSKAFLGLSMGCARCHNHKFDAISTKDYYALAGYLKSSRFHLATLRSEEKSRPILKRLEIVSAKVYEALVSETKMDLESRISKLLALPTPKNGANSIINESDGKAGSSQIPLFDGYLKGAAILNPNDIFHDLATLSDEKPKLDEFAIRKRNLLKRMNEQMNLVKEENSKTTLFADFAKDGFKKWFVSGEAFGVAPRSANLLTLKEGTQEIRESEGLCADSGGVSDRLEGALRSQTFVISLKQIAYHYGGSGCEINLVIDGFQRIRFPIYGALKIAVNSPNEMIWTLMNVEKWIGHKAYIELLDPGNGRIVCDKIVFTDTKQPTEPPNPLFFKLLEDPKIDSPEALRGGYLSLLKDSLKNWRIDSQSIPTPYLPFVNWMLKTGKQLTFAQALLPISKPVTPIPPGDVKTNPVPVLTGDRKSKADLEASLPTARHAMTLTEGTSEDDKVHIRGSFKTLGDTVPRRFLEAICGAKQPAPIAGSGRLDLAKRLVSNSNPLFSRVIVNRLWQHHFGEGIVRTPDDFGVMGEAPTNPELLDWLALNFTGGGSGQKSDSSHSTQPYSLKRLHRMMTTTSAYRMSSQIQNPKNELVDPLNKLVHRMPVRRLEAEAIRDSVLAVSGRLDPKLYGTSVLPNLSEFMQGRGRPASGPLDGDGRRSLYVSVRRNFLTPLFLAFDYPVPFNAIGRRTVSNVPAQALALMNNPFVVQQSELWSKKILASPAKTSAERITVIYNSAFGRLPEKMELEDAIAYLNSTPAAPNSPEELKTWSDFCHVILNLKEFIYVR